MANTTNGTYGTKRPAFITSDDCDIYYFYSKDRTSSSDNFTEFQKLESTYLETLDYSGETLPGMYNLKLPMSKFSDTGIYTIYIKPKEVRTTIFDTGNLDNYDDINGIIISVGDDSSMYTNGNLIGYRIEFFNSSGERLDYYRIITSNYYCEPVVQNNTVKYRYATGTSSLIFCTVTPNTSLSFKTDSSDYNGVNGQPIALINTKFNPIMMEVEMVEHDIETVSTMLEGDQIRNLDEGTITTFNSDGLIYHQASYGQAVDSNNEIHHDFKINDNSRINYTEEDKLTEIKNIDNE